MELLEILLTMIAIGVGGIAFFALGIAVLAKGVKRLIEWIIS